MLVRVKSKMKRPTLSVCIALATSGMFLGAARPASADLLWNWSYSCSLFSTQTKCDGGSGTFTTTTEQNVGADGFYIVTDMTGTVEGNTITSLEPLNSLGFKNDNKISVSGAPWANAGAGKITGIEFLTNNDPATNANVNLLYQVFIDDIVGFDTQIAGPNKLALESINFSDKQVGTVDPIGPVGTSAVPEPATWGLMALGIFFGAFLRFRRMADY
jgi:hypothetical protein